MKKTILYFAVFIAVSLAVTYGTDFVMGLIEGDSHTASTMQLLITSGVTSVTTILLFTAMRWCPVSRDYVRSRPWGTLFWTILLAVGVILPLAWLEELIPEAMRQDLSGDIIARMLGTTEGYFVVCMLAPLAEEVVFRGAIITSVMEWGRSIRCKHTESGGDTATSALTDSRIEWIAIVTGALFFALAHLNPAQAPHAIIMGILLGWLYVRTGSLLPCFIVHWINNSLAYVLIKMFPLTPMDSRLIDYFGGNSTAMIQALCSSLLIALPALYQLHLSFSRQKRR